jgi:hypothetical protein
MRVRKLAGAAQLEFARARLFATFRFALLQFRPVKRRDDGARQESPRQPYLPNAGSLNGHGGARHLIAPDSGDAAAMDAVLSA